MSSAVVTFLFRAGLKRCPFSRVRLVGNWGPDGGWTQTAMSAVDASAFALDVSFPEEDVGKSWQWGIMLDGPAGSDLWAIAAEVDDAGSSSRLRSFVLAAGAQAQSYALTRCDLGAVRNGAGLRFAVWAPNAKFVEVVLADASVGYVADDGTGALRSFAMTPGADGVWTAGAREDGALADFTRWVGLAYMFRVTRSDGSVVYRTDIWSRMQIGRGSVDPKGAPFAGTPGDLDGPPSCSVVIDPGVVVLASGKTQTAEAFWADEFTAGRALPGRAEDLVIYELHVGALGFGKAGVGTLDDAIRFVDHLQKLGVNAVELLPIAEFEAIASWGYGSSHFFAVDQAAGGTDRLKQFVKACHQRGIAVILDVCYNHFDPNADRVEWQFDTTDPTRNIYYWYEGAPGDYGSPDGGYIDNISTGYAPRFSEEMVRQLFISSAVELVEICHIDGFRLDQTSSIHEYPVLHANGASVPAAATFGLKFLKQWTRTMRLIRPSLFLFAEDYSNWAGMTQPSLNGDGVGFDATWYGDFHHNLIEHKDGAEAHLVQEAGFGDARPLHMSYFAGALAASGGAKVVYNESHDDCGNRDGSARTLVLAVNYVPLVGETRQWAEARVRFAAAMTLLSAGTPMFFMGEEVGAQRPYRYDDFLANREDILGLANGDGAALMAFYRDLIALSQSSGGIRSRNIDVIHAHDDNRVIGFLRWDESQTFFVAGSLNVAAFDHGYRFSHPRFDDAEWTEVLNSDLGIYGGWGVGNGGGVRSSNGMLEILLPASGAVVLRRSA